jgi:multidrug efflux pump subunit AcrA (membrane-fusion protein)
VSNKDGAMIPGQFVRVKLKAKTLKDALVVPTQAVVTNINGNFIYVVQAGDTVDLKPVKVI